MPTIPPEQPPPSERHRSRIRHRQMAESFGVGRRTLRPGPAPLPRRPGGADRRRQPRAATSSTSAAAPASRPGSSRRPAARCSASSPTRGWPSSPGGRGLEVEVATFEAWDPAGRTFDAVVAGQAWHWVDPVAGAAKAARVLRPGGRLAVFWNVVPAPARAWREAFAAVYRRVLPDSPFSRRIGDGRPWTCTRRCSPRPPTGSGRRARSASRSSGGSTGSGPTPATSGWTSCPPPAALTQLPPDQLAEVLAGIGAAIDAIGRRLHDGLHRDGRHCRPDRPRWPPSGRSRLTSQA